MRIAVYLECKKNKCFPENAREERIPGMKQSKQEKIIIFAKTRNVSSESCEDQVQSAAPSSGQTNQHPNKNVKW